MNMNHLHQFFSATAASLILAIIVSPAWASDTQVLPGGKNESRLMTNQDQSEKLTDLSVQTGHSSDSALTELIVETSKGYQVYSGNHGPHETIVFKNGAVPTIITKAGNNGLIAEFSGTQTGVFAQALSN